MDRDEKASLDCPVCLEEYNEGRRTPKMMPCLHTVCASCVFALSSSPPSSSYIITPPTYTQSNPPPPDSLDSSDHEYENPATTTRQETSGGGAGALVTLRHNNATIQDLASILQGNRTHPALRRVSGYGFLPFSSSPLSPSASSSSVCSFPASPSSVPSSVDSPSSSSSSSDPSGTSGPIYSLPPSSSASSTPRLPPRSPHDPLPTPPQQSPRNIHDPLPTPPQKPSRHTRSPLLNPPQQPTRNIRDPLPRNSRDPVPTPPQPSLVQTSATLPPPSIAPRLSSSLLRGPAIPTTPATLSTPPSSLTTTSPSAPVSRSSLPTSPPPVLPARNPGLRFSGVPELPQRRVATPLAQPEILRDPVVAKKVEEEVKEAEKELEIPKDKVLQCPLCRSNIDTNKLQTNRYVLAHLRDLARLKDLRLAARPPTDSAHQQQPAHSTPSAPAFTAENLWCISCDAPAKDACAAHELSPIDQWVEALVASVEELEQRVELDLDQYCRELEATDADLNTLGLTLNKAAKHQLKMRQEAQKVRDQLKVEVETPPGASHLQQAQALSKKISSVRRLEERVKKLVTGVESSEIYLYRQNNKLFISTSRPDSTIIISISHGHIINV